MEESSHEDCLPFFLDDDSSGPEGSPSSLRRPSMKSSFGFSLDTKGDRREAASTSSNNMNLSFGYGSATDNLESIHSKVDSHRPSDRNLGDPLKSMDQRSPNTQSRGTKNPIMFFFPLISVYGLSRSSMS